MYNFYSKSFLSPKILTTERYNIAQQKNKLQINNFLQENCLFAVYCSGTASHFRHFSSLNHETRILARHCRRTVLVHRWMYRCQSSVREKSEYMGC